MSKLAYVGTKISPNQMLTKEGYLVALNVPICRTGYQEYTGKELEDSDGFDKEWGLSPEKVYKVYRPLAEVTSPETVASFEGKSVADNHPGEAYNGMITVETDKELGSGHAENVRVGPKIEEGEFKGETPLLADLWIKDLGLIDKVDHGIRDISCGYLYKLKRLDDGTLVQTDIRGNHVAVVNKGRAGKDIAIGDAAPEKKPARGGKKMPINLKRIFGMGLKQLANDAEPEEVAEAAKEFAKHEEGEDRRHEEDRHRGDDRSRGDDRGRAMDRHRGEDYRREEDRIRGNDRSRENDEGDRRAEDLHRLLDRVLDSRRREDDRSCAADRSHEDDISRADDLEGYMAGGEFHPIRGSKGYKRSTAGEGRRRRRRAHDSVGDTDIDELEDLLTEFLGEEGNEPQHEDDSHRGKDSRAKDVDVDKLAELLKNFFEEEKQEPQHQDDRHRGKDGRRREDDEDSTKKDDDEDAAKVLGKDAETDPDLMVGNVGKAAAPTSMATDSARELVRALRKDMGAGKFSKPALDAYRGFLRDLNSGINPYGIFTGVKLTNDSVGNEAIDPGPFFNGKTYVEGKAAYDAAVAAQKKGGK